MTFHPAAQPPLGLAARRLDQLRTQGPAKEQRQDDDHQNAAREFGTQERPAQQDQQDEAQLEDQVRRGKLEHHRRREAGAFQEERASDRHGGVGAG